MMTRNFKCENTIQWSSFMFPAIK